MKKRFNTLLPHNIKTDVAFQSKQLSSCFNIKDKTEFPHKQDLVYHARCPEESCNDDYVGERTRRISERVAKSLICLIKVSKKYHEKASYFKTTNKKNALVCNMRISKLLVVVFEITLRRENYQTRCGLTLSDLH